MSNFIFDVSDLRKNVGTTFEETKRLHANSDMGNPIISIKEGSPMNLNVELDSVTEGIFAQFVLQAVASGECSRCLDPLKQTTEASGNAMFEYHAQEQDDEQYLVIDDTIDLEPLVRDTVVTQLAFNPVCKDDCLGLCSSCGFRMEEDPQHHHEVKDPRWSALEGLINNENKTEED
ncbi:MAG: DUF177 domain-containing protein [Micrococcaceae bacterium]